MRGVLHQPPAHFGQFLLLLGQPGILLVDDLVLLVNPTVQVQHFDVLVLDGSLIGVGLSFEVADQFAGLQ